MPEKRLSALRRSEMAIVLFVLSGLSFMVWLVTSTTAETIFQQIVGAISLVTSAILFTGAAIVNAVNKLKNKT